MDHSAKTNVQWPANRGPEERGSTQILFAPKFAANLWMASPEGGLAAIAYGPSTVTTLVAGGTALMVEEHTDYPFRDLIHLTVKPERAVTFPLMLRIPSWASAASVAVNGQSQSGIRAGTFFTLNRQWRPGDRVEIRFPMLPRATTWYNDSLAIERGPLVYSLKIGESWHELTSFGPSKDWEVFPSSPWNYALALENDNPAASIKVRAPAYQPRTCMNGSIFDCCVARPQ